jgi:hypothetical protein
MQSLSLANKKISRSQLILISSCQKSLNIYIKFLQTLFNELSIFDFSFFFFSNSRSLITLLKSPHVNKKAKEQFQSKKFKVLVSLPNNNVKLISYLISNKPRSITLKIVRQNMF